MAIWQIVFNKKGNHDRIFLFQKTVKAFGFFSQKEKKRLIQL